MEGDRRGRACRSSPRRFAAASSRRARALIARMTIPTVSMTAILLAGSAPRNRANVMFRIGRMTYVTSAGYRPAAMNGAAAHRGGQAVGVEIG